MNLRFTRWGRIAPLSLAVAFMLALVVNVRLQGRLFTFSSHDDLYRNWWASLTPLRPGGVAWVLIGGFGLYMVYVEAVLGFTYLNFLRRRSGDYQFRANMLNPDGLFGWSRVRQIVSDLEAGVLCTLLSAWAMWFYFQPALGSAAAIIVLVLFAGTVLYVFVGVTSSFRRQVKADRRAQRTEIGAEIALNSQSPDVAKLVSALLAYKRLELVSKIPAAPVRPAWLVAGAISVVGPISALAVQLLKYFKAG